MSERKKSNLAGVNLKVDHVGETLENRSPNIEIKVERLKLRVILGVVFDVQDALFETTHQVFCQLWSNEGVILDRIIELGLCFR